MIYRGKEGFEKFVNTLYLVASDITVTSYNVSVLQYVVYPRGESAGITAIAQQPLEFYWKPTLSKEENTERFISIVQSTIEYSIKSKCYSVLSDQGNGALPKEWESAVDTMITTSFVDNIKVNIPENLTQHKRFNLLLMCEFKMPKWNVKLPSVITTIMNFPFEWNSMGVYDPFDL